MLLDKVFEDLHSHVRVVYLRRPGTETPTQTRLAREGLVLVLQVDRAVPVRSWARVGA